MWLLSTEHLPTDIREDFRITDIIIQVPPSATHLFAAAHDSFYSDNLDFNGDFSIQLVLRPCEPAANPAADCNGNALDDECEIAAGNYVEAVDTLNSIPDRVDGEIPPKDRIEDSDEKDLIAEQVHRVIILLEYLAHE